MTLSDDTAYIPPLKRQVLRRFLIKPAKKMPARCENCFVNTTDLYATVLELAGASREVAEVAEVAEAGDGRSLVPVLDGKTPENWPDCAVTEDLGIGAPVYVQRMIRRENWKYVFHPGGMDELYDLKNDPHEMKNRASDSNFAANLAKMQRALAGWMKTHNDPLRWPLQQLRGVK